MKALRAACLLVALLAPLPASAAGEHADPAAPVVLAIAVILVAAKLGGEVAVRVGQPAVLGELLIGMALGNLPLLGFRGLDYLKSDPSVDMLARIGVLLLLFEVGLESTVRQILKVGFSALLVAAIGVAVPFALGWGIGAWLFPSESPYTAPFLGATLTATSVGITARVLKDLGRSQTTEARIILGAAVIDDVLGLLLLAVVSGIVTAAGQGGGLSAIAIVKPLGKAVGFLDGALTFGVLLTPRLFATAARLRNRGVLLATGLVLCFVLAWLADRIGLAPIVGAFAAGLVLEGDHYRKFVEQGERPLEELVHPISAFLVPIFFVLMGMRTELRSLARPDALGLAAALTLVAIVGKLVSSLGAVERGVDRLSLGIGMVPRGEVGLIFANIGLSLTVGDRPLIDQSTFSAIVAMVIATTMFVPPALKWSLQRRAARSRQSPSSVPR